MQKRVPQRRHTGQRSQDPEEGGPSSPHSLRRSRALVGQSQVLIGRPGNPSAFLKLWEILKLMNRRQKNV